MTLMKLMTLESHKGQMDSCQVLEEVRNNIICFTAASRFD